MEKKRKNRHPNSRDLNRRNPNSHDLLTRPIAAVAAVAAVAGLLLIFCGGRGARAQSNGTAVGDLTLSNPTLGNLIVNPTLGPSSLCSTTNNAANNAASSVVKNISCIPGNGTRQSATLPDPTLLSTLLFAAGSATDRKAAMATAFTLSGPPSGSAGAASTYGIGAAPVYTRVDATDPIYGQNIMLLVPNSNAATPYDASTPTKLILYVHGSGESQSALLDDRLKASCVTALLNAGYILAGTAAHGTRSWGNPASVDDYIGLWRYCTANYNISKTALWGQSMGGIPALSILSEQRIPDIVGFLGTYPTVSLANVYRGAGGGTNFSSAIDTAYGITGSGNATYANLTIGMDPALKWGGAFRRVPMRLYASSGDTVVPKAAHTDVLAALVGSSARVTVVTATGDHGHTSHFVPNEYVAFFNACFAGTYDPPAPKTNPK